MQRRENISHINNERWLKQGPSLEISYEFNLDEIWAESDPFNVLRFKEIILVPERLAIHIEWWDGHTL